MITTQPVEFNPVPERMLYGPAAYCARAIENLLIYCKESEGVAYAITCIAVKAIGLTIFPVTLAIGLAVEPLFLGRSIAAYYLGYEGADKAWDYSAERISKLALGIIFSPLAIIAADGVSYLFLERVPTDLEIRPFGVEHVYGKTLKDPIIYPSTVQEVIDALKKAKKENKTISVIGAGLSQGEQTVPDTDSSIVLNLKKLKGREFVPGRLDAMEVGAGATWEEVLMVANQQGKSVISKQAGSFFNTAAAVATNIHGWQHDVGSLSRAVESVTIVNADGELVTVGPEEELFGCLFGTFGYFGVIVSVTFKLEDNEFLQESGTEVPISEFHTYYQENIKGNPTKPLLMGRLNIDGRPLQKVTINTFDQIHPKPVKAPVITPNLEIESHRGERIARCFLDAVGHLPKPLYAPLVSWYWNRELEIMQEGRVATRNEIMNYEVKSFLQLAQSDLYSQWLQEYFVTGENLASFLEHLGSLLEKNDVRLLNASIRPVPKDEISVLPYAEQDRYAVVISFSQIKVTTEMKKTETWVRAVQEHLCAIGGKWYQPYMPFATQKEFEESYGKDTVDNMRRLKMKYDPDGRFSNGHTTKYYTV